MTDVTKKTVSMDKPGTATSPSPGTKAPLVRIPRTIQFATAAIIAEVVFTLGHALAARGFTDQLNGLMKHANKVAKKPVANFDAAKSVADYRNGLLVQGLVFCVAMVILGFSVRRARGASGARWAILIILVLMAQSNGPMAVFPISGYPGALQVLRILMGLSSIAIIVFILLPDSMRYFRECKAATHPEGTPARGLAGLFGPRSATAARGAASGQRAAGRAREATTEANPARGKARAKVRADADAVAKGADLARTRAKASKSRRSAEPTR